MKIIFSRHAKRQMKWRNISEDEVLRVVAEPAEDSPSVKERINIWENESRRGLKITISREKDLITIVTAVRKD